MTSPSSCALGLSVGVSTLAAVGAGRIVTSRPVISRGGVRINDFVNRVGDPVGIVAPDGSVHTGAALLAEALYALSRTTMSGRPVPAVPTVAHPAHWGPAAVDALGRELRRIQAWSTGARLIPDYAAALTALHNSPGLPARGVIAVCDIGAGATTLTLVEASGLRPVGAPLRFPDFSGDLIDRALLTHVLTAAGGMPGATGTSAIGALTRLRGACREAKERLSAQIVSTVPGEPAGLRGEIRITRAELDAIVRGPLTCVVAALQDTLRRNGIAAGELAAVASVGGMAAVPAVTTTLSEHLRVPVITCPQPGLTTATGAALQAARATDAAPATVVNPTRNRSEPAQPALAWSQAADIPDVVPQRPTRRPQPRPPLDFAPPSEPVLSGDTRLPWHHRPLVIAAAVLAVVAGSGGVTALALRADTHALPARSEPSGSLTGTPAAVSPAGAGDAPRTVVAVPAPAPVEAQAAAFTETVVAAPLPEAVAPVAEGPVSLILTLPPIPALPQIPIPSITGLPPLIPPPSSG